jgi:hypothetical protein
MPNPKAGKSTSRHVQTAHSIELARHMSFSSLDDQGWKNTPRLFVSDCFFIAAPARSREIKIFVHFPGLAVRFLLEVQIDEDDQHLSDADHGWGSLRTE